MSELTASAYHHMKRPLGVEPLVEPDFEAVAGQEGHGPFFKVRIKLSQGHIVAVSFSTICCPWATAIGSAATQWLEGKDLSEVDALNETCLENVLGGVPRPKRDYLKLAVAAVRLAVALPRCGSLERV